MQPTASTSQRAPSSAKTTPQGQKFSPPERVAHTPKEFAAAFGRSETWGYRQLYSGRVKVVQLSGRLLIPKSEIDRLLAEATVYNGVPARAPKAKRLRLSADRQSEGIQFGQ